VKTHYDLLGLDPSADVETIRKAFRREIAKYHPDKVTHLGAEFQEMASSRAAELTAAYKILTDPQARADYDEGLQGASRPDRRGGTPQNGRVATYEPPARESEHTSGVAPPTNRFDQDRAGRDDIVRRATLMRLREALRQVMGECDMPTVQGFDLACLPRAKPVTLSQLFNRQVLPIVLARIVGVVDGKVATEAFSQAVRARLAGKANPVVVLIIGDQLAPGNELARAIELARKRSPASQDRIFPVPIDGRDWSAKIPLNAPDAVRSLLVRLRSSA
jgi:curved DNA-binding protein CbpA